jgi:hypothetical protein
MGVQDEHGSAEAMVQQYGGNAAGPLPTESEQGPANAQQPTESVQAEADAAEVEADNNGGRATPAYGGASDDAQMEEEGEGETQYRSLGGNGGSTTPEYGNITPEYGGEDDVVYRSLGGMADEDDEVEMEVGLGPTLSCRNNECEDATDAETDYGDDAAEDAEEMEDAIMDGEEDFGSQGSVHDALHDSTPRWNEMCSQ